MAAALRSGALRHPQLGLAPALMDDLFQGLGKCSEVNQGSGIC